MTNITRAELLSNIEKQLSREKMSRVQIMAHFQKGKTVITNCLDTLRKYKRIYICEHDVFGRRITPIYKTGSLPDAVYLPKYEAKKKERLLNIEPIYVVPKTIKHHELLEWAFKCQSLQ
jgi:hypothetical protein